MSGKHFILDGKQPVPVDLLTWGRWFGANDNGRFVARTPVGDAEVSTVFIGLDHNFRADGPPLIFETMAFGGACDGATQRYSTWEQAEAGHAAMVERVKQAEEQP